MAQSKINSLLEEKTNLKKKHKIQMLVQNASNAKLKKDIEKGTDELREEREKNSELT